MKQSRAILLLAVSSGKQAAERKQSLPEQDERLHELAAELGWNIVDIITVPGHSRVYYTYREFAEDAIAEGIPAPMRMFDHWRKRDFDVFACSSGDRFGREQSIFAEVVGRTIDAGAVVYTLRDGEINKGNRRMFVSMGGYQASVEIDELVRRHHFGMNRRAQRGLPMTSYGHIRSHTTVGRGENERTIINEDARRLFADIAELLLSGLSWRQMPNALAERGHFRAGGAHLSASTIRKWLMHPTLWGNTARRFQDADHFPVARGFWVFDPNEPAPPYVIIHYGTHPPMYTGALAARIQAELRRRFRPNHQPPPKRRFSGLVVCDQCHYACNYKQDGGYLGIHCASRMQIDLATECTNTRYVNEKALIAFAGRLLDRLAESGDWTALYGEAQVGDSTDKLAQVEVELSSLKAQAKDLMRERATVPRVFRDELETTLQELAARAEALEVEQSRLNREAAAAAPNTMQLLALEDYRRLRPGELWEKPPPEINQWLSRILGNRRFVIADGKVIGTSAVPLQYRPPRRKSERG